MTRGTGPTSNKFSKTVGAQTQVISVGNGAGFITMEDLKAGRLPDLFTVEDMKEILAIYEPEKRQTASEVASLIGKEAQGAPTPDAKRGPGRPRKVDPEVGSAGEVFEAGSE